MNSPFIIASFWAITIRAIPFSPSDSRTPFSSAPHASVALSLTTSLDTSSSANHVTASSLEIQCNGADYGFNPSLPDCQVALSRIPIDSKQQRFGDRDLGPQEVDIPLPYKTMGGKVKRSRKMNHCKA